MTSLQAAVHLKLLSTLPVRTHCVPMETSLKGGGRVRTDAECAVVRMKIQAMQAKGWKVAKIAKHLEMSRQTVYNYLRKR
jgi:transcriptional regulator of acetoin/glycerol metabolism